MIKRNNQNAKFFFFLCNLSFISASSIHGDWGKVKLTFIRSTNAIGYIQLIRQYGLPYTSTLLYKAHQEDRSGDRKNFYFVFHLKMHSTVY